MDDVATNLITVMEKTAVNYVCFSLTRGHVFLHQTGRKIVTQMFL